MAVFDPTESSIGRDPESSAGPKTKIGNCPFAKSVLRRIELAYRAIIEIRDPTMMKTQPQATLRRIGCNDRREIIVAKRRP